jgi:hypothetical protein
MTLHLASRQWCIAETKTKAAHATANRSAVARDNMGKEFKDIQTNSKSFAPRVKNTVFRRCPGQSSSPLLTARNTLGSSAIHQLDHSSPHIHTSKFLPPHLLHLKPHHLTPNHLTSLTNYFFPTTPVAVLLVSSLVKLPALISGTLSPFNPPAPCPFAM